MRELVDVRFEYGVSFTENVFYEFRDERIEKVWSVIDKAAIESQL